MESVDQDTGEIIRFEHDSKGGLRLLTDPVEAALRRHRLLHAARSILSRFEDAHGHPRFRTSHCNFTPTGSRVEVYLSKNSKYATFSVQHCGSVWLCPVCASRIASARAERIQTLIDNHKNAGGEIGFLTLTIPHKLWSSLETELQIWDAALKKFSSGRGAQDFRVAHEIKGFVRALEINHGANGWHVHAHILVFFNRSPDFYQLKSDLFKFWIKCCPKNRRPSFKRGIDIVPADRFVSTYLSKWGVSDEISRSHMKNARKKTSRTPFELLADSYDGDEKSKNLFAEFADAFVKAGEKRARSRKQIFTSSTLSNLAPAEISEDADAKNILNEGQGVCIGSIDLKHFDLIRKHNDVGLALEIVKRGGVDALIELIDSYKEPV